MISCFKDSSGNKYWSNSKGQFHRIKGPAYEGINGDKCWYLNDQFHRLDGPAIIKNNGHKEWYIRGERLSEEEFERWLRLKGFW